MHPYSSLSIPIYFLSILVHPLCPSIPSSNVFFIFPSIHPSIHLSTQVHPDPPRLTCVRPTCHSFSYHLNPFQFYNSMFSFCLASDTSTEVFKCLASDTSTEVFQCLASDTSTEVFQCLASDTGILRFFSVWPPTLVLKFFSVWPLTLRFSSVPQTLVLRFFSVWPPTLVY